MALLLRAAYHRLNRMKETVSFLIQLHIITRYILAGLAAGSVTGILGSGGGLVLVPLLTFLCKEDKEIVFPCSVGIMLPICFCSFLLQNRFTSVPFRETAPYLIGGAIGGCFSVVLAKRTPLVWLHRFFGCILLWSGFRCLFS